jgi:hypothetical protein
MDLKGLIMSRIKWSFQLNLVYYSHDNMIYIVIVNFFFP